MIDYSEPAGRVMTFESLLRCDRGWLLSLFETGSHLIRLVKTGLRTPSFVPSFLNALYNYASIH
jgi:hypothetical protein